MQLQNQFGQATAENELLQSAQEEAQEQLYRLNQELRERASNRNEPLEDALAEVARVKAELQEARSTIERLSKDKDDLKETVTQDRQVIQQTQSDLTFYQNSAEELRDRQQAFLRTQADKQAIIDSQKQEISQQAGEISGLKRRLDTASQEN